MKKHQTPSNKKQHISFTQSQIEKTVQERDKQLATLTTTERERLFTQRAAHLLPPPLSLSSPSLELICPKAITSPSPPPGSLLLQLHWGFPRQRSHDAYSGQPAARNTLSAQLQFQFHFSLSEKEPLSREGEKGVRAWDMEAWKLIPLISSSKVTNSNQTSRQLRETPGSPPSPLRLPLPFYKELTQSQPTTPTWPSPVCNGDTHMCTYT